MITNRLNLPDAIVRAVANDGYSRGASDISCTELIGPPLIRRLKNIHRNELQEDVSDRIWSLLGQAVHSVAERAQGPGELSEERLYADCDGMRVSGQFDLFDGETITDIKVTSVWAVKDGLKPEWGAQLNVLAWLLRENGFSPRRAQIVAILRDWRKNERNRYGDDYPPEQAVVIPATLLDEYASRLYVFDRVAAHRADPAPLCTPEERWERPDTWAVMRNGRRSALRVLDDEGAATEWSHNYCESTGCRKGVFVTHRPGASVRCESYCPVRTFCEYGQSLESR